MSRHALELDCGLVTGGPDKEPVMCKPELVGSRQIESATDCGEWSGMQPIRKMMSAAYHFGQVFPVSKRSWVRMYRQLGAECGLFGPFISISSHTTKLIGVQQNHLEVHCSKK